MTKPKAPGTPAASPPTAPEEQPTAACTYRRNPDGSLTQLDEPTIVPDFAPKE